MTKTPEIPVPTQRMVGQEVVVDALTGVVYTTGKPSKPEDQQAGESPNQITGKKTLKLADYNL